MIDRRHGHVIFHCDSCDEESQHDDDDFDAAWAAAKREGWRARKIGTEWIHACPTCELDRP